MSAQVMLHAPPDEVDEEIVARAIAYIDDMVLARGMDTRVSDEAIKEATKDIIRIERRLFTKRLPVFMQCPECDRILYQACTRAFHEPTQQWYCVDHYPMPCSGGR